MVVTRAMAAQAAAENAHVATVLVPRESATHNEGEDLEDVDDAVVSFVEHTTVAPSNVEAGPRFEDPVGGWCATFFDRTAQLVMQNNFIQANQCNQAAAQNAALMAVKASAESDVQRLAAFQELSKADTHTFLESAREAMRNDIMKLVQIQPQTGVEIQTSLTARIAESFQAAQREDAVAVVGSDSDSMGGERPASEAMSADRSNLDAVVVVSSDSDVTLLLPSDSDSTTGVSSDSDAAGADTGDSDAITDGISEFNTTGSDAATSTRRDRMQRLGHVGANELLAGWHSGPLPWMQALLRAHDRNAVCHRFR